ncbi:SYP4 [Auxenochlorella protothecoides x Auxenochlorella symbiontica]
MRPRFGPGEAESSRATTTSGSAPVGTIRNRSDVFFRYRRNARAGSRPLLSPGASAAALDGNETARLMASALGGMSDAEVGPEPPQYVTFREAARAEMLTIRTEMTELRGLHGRATLSRFDESNDDEIQVEVTTQQITKLFRRCEARLQKFGSVPSENEADEKVKRNLQRTLAAELQELSIQFRKQQKAYLAQLRRREAGSAAPGGALGGLALAARDGDYDTGFSSQQALQADTLSALIDDRDREVAGIVASIHELAQIMKDLSVLVIDQGTVLDRIDYNMEATAAQVTEGVKQLAKAEKKQKQGLMAVCIMFLLVAIGILVLFVVIKAIVF